MPPLDHLAATASVDLFFERTITGLPAKLRNDPTAGALFVNLCRLTDKALREYEAARGLLGEYRNAGAQRVVNPLLVIDHMENCIEATYRAVQNAKRLCANGIRIESLAPTATQEDDLRLLRNRLIHMDERLIDKRLRPGQHFGLMLTEKRVEINERTLTYRQLAFVIAKCHKTIEKIRGRATTAPQAAPPGAQPAYISEIFAEVLGRAMTPH
jgi:hypothetical protein